ncbi:MAG: DegT/DnrJ/EryC1/StrS family aminotransferase [Magnetococcales bacterium]|nr:DegT/DnrJ/EryC1/StrS family aminotransferase [Magnetococcales bacterium]MBF0155905.1 DegT/DnrJ/EryC1/StrS family aminotransferase [Magnetococcales bacterium]
MKRPIPVNTPVLGGNERRYLLECIDSEWISSEGPFVARFEEAFAGRVGRRYATSVTSGTAALEVALAAIGLKPGDEVILPSFTIISCAAAVLRLGGKPVVVECDRLTWNMDVSRIRERINGRTKAIMPVHIFGMPVDLDPVLELAREHGLYVIEDAAQAQGLTYKGRPCGSFGHISAFSFYPNKLVTTGEGGMVVCDDPELDKRCRSYRNLCFLPERRFVHEEIGWNYRMTNLQAALGLAQVERWDASVVRKREIGRTYQKLLRGLNAFQLPVEGDETAENLYWVFGLVIPEGGSLTAGEVMVRLGQEKIGTRPFFWPMHAQPVLREMGLFADESLPVSLWLGRNGFYIPSGLGLTPEEQQRVVEVLWELYG